VRHGCGLRHTPSLRAKARLTTLAPGLCPGNAGIEQVLRRTISALGAPGKAPMALT